MFHPPSNQLRLSTGNEMEWKRDRFEVVQDAFRLVENDCTIEELQTLIEEGTYFKLTKTQISALREKLQKPGRPKLTDMMDEIIRWFEKHPELYCPKRHMLPSFLFTLNFDMGKAKKMLVDYYKSRYEDKEFFSNRHQFSNDILDILQVCTLPKHTDELYSIVIIRLKEHEVEQFRWTEVVRMVLNLADIILMDGLCTGQVAILDIENFKKTNILKLSLSLLRRAVDCVLQRAPAKVKAIHVINSSTVGKILVSMIKPFLKRKLADRIYMHSDRESLKKHFPKSLLPVEFGGDNGSIEERAEYWKKLITQDKVEYFSQLERDLNKVYDY